MDNKRYGVLVVGAGYMGKAHIDGIINGKNVKIIAVIDKDYKTAKEAADSYSISEFGTDYMPYVSDSRVQIVIIATYPNTHFSIAKVFMDNGKHIICEKPISNNLSEARVFYNYALKSNTKIIFGHILRFNETYIKVCKMIKENKIGLPIVMRISQSKKVESNDNTFSNLLMNSYPVIDCGVHYFDVMRWFTGADAISFSGIGQCLDPQLARDTYNYGLVTMKFSDGSSGFYEACWSRNVSTTNLKEFIGPKGRIQIIYQSERDDNIKSNLIIYENSETGEAEYIDVPYEKKPIDLQMQFFISMIENNIDHKPFLHDVFRAMQEVILAHRAICENRTFYTLDNIQPIYWNPDTVL